MSSKRVLEIAQRFDLKGEDVLENVQVTCIYTPDHLEKTLQKVRVLLVTHPDNVGALVSLRISCSAKRRVCPCGGRAG